MTEAVGDLLAEVHCGWVRCRVKIMSVYRIAHVFGDLALVAYSEPSDGGVAIQTSREDVIRRDGQRVRLFQKDLHGLMLNVDCKHDDLRGVSGDHLLSRGIAHARPGKPGQLTAHTPGPLPGFPPPPVRRRVVQAT